MSLSLLGLAFLLGIKHSYDADHLIAVSAVLHRVTSFIGALRVGASWAVGHMLTAALITALLFAFKDSALGVLLSYFETVVAFLLIGLGFFALRSAVFHPHIHTHGEKEHAHLAVSETGEHRHTHRYMFGVGVIHGLASNDELLTLLTVSLGVATFTGTILGIGVFSIGVVCGMLGFCAAFSFPWLRLRSEMAQKILALTTGLMSVGYGAAMLLHV